MADLLIQFAVLTVFPAAMVLAAVSDLFTMSISNRLVVGMAIAFFVLAPLAGMSLDTMLVHVGVGAVMLLIGIAMFALGWIGGGDAKLIAATTLWLGLQPLASYLVVATFAGCALTIALLTFRRMPLPSWIDGQPWVMRLHRADNGAPYCVALALGGLMAYPASVWFSLAAG